MERNTKTQDDIKYKTAQTESQDDSSFPVHDHQAIPNKANKKSKTTRMRKRRRQPESGRIMTSKVGIYFVACERGI